MTLPIRLSDRQLHEVQQAAQMVPFDLRPAFLERLALELRGKDLASADGLIHHTAYRIARSIVWESEQTAFG
jgi:hypothetical protein